MPRLRRPSKEEIRARRNAVAERARAGRLTLPDAISEIRHALGMTQQEFANLFSLTLRQVKELEQGLANPTAATLNRVAKVFGFSLGFVPQRNHSKAPTSTDEISDQAKNRLSARDPVAS